MNFDRFHLFLSEFIPLPCTDVELMLASFMKIVFSNASSIFGITNPTLADGTADWSTNKIPKEITGETLSLSCTADFREIELFLSGCKFVTRLIKIHLAVDRSNSFHDLFIDRTTQRVTGLGCAE